jgi:uncharacterized repeat protein (TIGR03803 family)
MDAAGDIFGTTFSGGAGDAGAVFELVNNADGNYTPISLFSFNVTDGAGPSAGLTADAQGNLFGTTYDGGLSGDGTVFELVNNGDGSYTPITLVNFNGADGELPESRLIINAAGDLFGTTAGIANDYGTVFEIVKTDNGYASTPITLVSFDGTDGRYPVAGLTADAAGDLFGTTSQGGAENGGTAFELTDTGFQVPCFCRRTPILTERGEVAVEDLAVGDRVVSAIDGESRTIVWIGWGRVDCTAARDPQKVWPVRVRAGAFADGVPNRDLYLSPGHAVLPPGEDELIPIGHLVNGDNIAFAPCDSVTYWHVELDEHDIMLAGGLAAESFLDVGNGDRDWFAMAAGGHRSQNTDFRTRTYAEMRRPYFVEWDRVDATKALLRSRARTLEPA